MIGAPNLEQVSIVVAGATAVAGITAYVVFHSPRKSKVVIKSRRASPEAQEFPVKRRRRVTGTTVITIARGDSDHAIEDAILEELNATLAHQATPKDGRFVNVVVLTGTDPAGRVRHLETDGTYRLRLNIGPLETSDVVNRVPFPEASFGGKDAWLEVMVSSSQFQVYAHNSDGASHDGRSASARLLLPANPAEASLSETGEAYLTFDVRTPSASGRAQLRISVYFRDALLQSTLLSCDLTATGRNFRIETDFTVSAAMTDIHRISPRQRVSVLLNSAGSSSHEITCRVPGSPTATAKCATFAVKDVAGRVAGDLRETLVQRSFRSGQRSRDDLKSDLRALAPRGFRLYETFAAGLEVLLNQIDTTPDDVMVSISRPATSTFTLPWNLTYDIALDESAIADPKRIPVCPMVERWDGQQELFLGSPRQCPASDEHDHSEGLLCPFGFWGNRYSIEQIVRSEDVVMEIPLPASPQCAALVTRRLDSPESLGTHLTHVERMCQTQLNSSGLEISDSKMGARTLLGSPLSLVYLYCHGERPARRSPNTYLAIGRKDIISPGDFMGWIRAWLRQRNALPWGGSHPLVFVNACHSLEINPDTTTTYVDAFVGSGRAAGVIGTEVSVPQGLAMEFATSFFDGFLQPTAGGPFPALDPALRSARMQFLRAGSLFGLAYTSYAWGDLAFSPA